MGNESKNQLENAVLTAGEIVDSFIISSETERYLYPYQLPMVSRGLPGLTMNDMSFLQDPRYTVYIVSKRISGKTLGTVGLKSEVIDTTSNLRQPGTRFVLPDDIKIQDLVDRGFLLKLERGQQYSIPYLGDPYADKGFYNPQTGESNWPKDSGFKNSRFALKHLKRFSFVDRFGSDRGSFLCPARFKSPKLKYDACSKVLEEIKTYKQNFVDQIIDPITDLLFDITMSADLKQKLKLFMKDLCEQYYSITKTPSVRETDFSEEQWCEYLTIILTNLLLRQKSLTDVELPTFMKDCVNKILEENLYNVAEHNIESKVSEYIKTRAKGDFTVAETLYEGYLNLINAEDISFGEQQVMLSAIEDNLFKVLASNLKPDIFASANPSDEEKFDLLLMIIPYLAVSVVIWDETLFSMESLLKSEIISNIFTIAKIVKDFNLPESLKNFILSNLEIYPVTERALLSNVEIKDEYNLYIILDNLNGLYGLVEPWFSSKGDAEQIKLSQNSYIDQISDSKNVHQDSCETLMKEGFLLKIAMVKKEEQLQILYGGND